MINIDKNGDNVYGVGDGGDDINICVDDDSRDDNDGDFCGEDDNDANKYPDISL